MRDLRHGARSLKANPTFTITAVLTLALGVGASTAGFSLANWLLFRPLAGVHEGGRVAVIWFGGRQSDGFTRSYPVGPSQLPAITSAVPALHGFAGHAAGEASVTDGRAARHVDLEFVMPGYFSVLGTQPEIGRLLQEDDDVAPSGLPVAVIGHDLWLDLFAGDHEVVGRSLRVNTRLFTVVGVAPLGFHGVDREHPADLWLPGRASLLVNATHGAPVPGEPFYSEFVSRLARRATFDQAEEQLRAVSQRVIGQPPVVFQGVGLWPPIRATAEDTGRLLLGVTAVVLLIACANTANLLLFRGLARRPQIGMRRVLGAGTADLVRERLAETLVLGMLAGALGLVLGRWLVDAFQGLSLWSGSIPLRGVSLDWHVGLFASGAALGSAVLAGVAPAWLAAGTEPGAAIRGGRVTHPHGKTLRQSFAGLQVALSITLVVGALFVVETLRNLNRVNLGFDPHDVSAMSITPAEQGMQQGQLQIYYRELLRRVREIPGVDAAALGASYPLARRGAYMLMQVLPSGGETDRNPITVVVTRVSPDYFSTLRVPLIAGRTFSDGEFLRASESPSRVAIISQSLARRLFGDRDPIGDYLGPDPRLEIVGVVGDIRYMDLAGSPRTPWHEGELLYVPMQGAGMGSVALVVRARLGHGQTMAAIRAVAAQVAPSIPLYHDETLNEALTRYLSDRILFARLLSLLSALAVCLAAVGLYGLVAYGVTSQTREIGIRIALGAQKGRVLSVAAREGVVVCGAGTAVGLGGAAAVARLLESRLYGLSPFDPAIYGLAAIILGTVALIAALIPARNATRIDPMVALRAE